MVLAAVFILVAVRHVGRFNFKIWQIMLGGAVAVLITGQIAPLDALRAINIDVMIFLFGMFVVGEALVASGYLFSVASRIFTRTQNTDQLVLALLFGMGILSAILMNDTLAIIGTPLVLGLATRFRISKKLLLLALAFAITTGSVMSPIGNPQNLLVAVNSGMGAPFVTFGLYLAIPTLACLVASYALLRIFYPREFHPCPVCVAPEVIPDRDLTLLVKCSLVILVSLAAVNIGLSLIGQSLLVPLPLIAVCAALPVLLFSQKRFRVLKQIDWYTLIFFVAMFIVMASVWQSGFFQQFVGEGGITAVPAILVSSVVISQFISNVPFVALFLPMIMQAGGTTSQLMALAAGSTIAGNLTILGAASNVIIIQQAEKEGATLTFLEFAKIGVPLTLVQLAVYWVFLGFV
ncbi:MAG: SLC13 family permease [Methanoregula sp.]|nr:SLC13 family permease [Methanoregula sp.]